MNDYSSREQHTPTIAVMLVFLQELELESWVKCFYREPLVAGVGNHFISATVAGEVRVTVQMPVGQRVIGVTDKTDNVNIVREKKVKRLTVEMKIKEKNVLHQKRWATHLQTPSLP